MTELDPTFNDMKPVFWLKENGVRPIGEDVLCPRDGRPGCALVDWIPRHARYQASHFMSWTWQYHLGQVQSALEMWVAEHFNHPSAHSERVFFFMCFFTNNQFRVIVEGLSSGSDDLENAFRSNLTRIGQMVAILDHWKQPRYLTRVWTIYEQFIACSLQVPVVFILPQSSQESLKTQVCLGETGIRLVTDSRMPSSTLIPFLGGLGSLINPFKQKRSALFKPRVLGSLGLSQPCGLRRSRGLLQGGRGQSESCHSAGRIGIV